MQLRDILSRVKNGDIDIDEAEKQMR